MRKRALVALVVLPVTLALAAIAGASGDDRAAAAAILDEVGRDTAHRSVVAVAVDKSKTALERGTRMRAAGDEVHARLAEGLALDWAMVAKDLLGAASVEDRARAARMDVLDAGARVERERALLEEDIGRTGRLRAELEAQPRTEREAPRTSAVGERPVRHDQDRADGGAPRAVAAPPVPPAPPVRRPARPKASRDGGAP
jgi:hypothetical protein